MLTITYSTGYLTFILCVHYKSTFSSTVKKNFLKKKIQVQVFNLCYVWIGSTHTNPKVAGF